MRTKLLNLFITLMFIFGPGLALPAAAAPHANHDSTASGLRMVLASQLGEHVLLASSATNAALNEQQAEFEAAAASLDANSVNLAETIGVVYGAEAQDAFLELWRTHIGFFVDYTDAVATDDQAAKDEALQSLEDYGQTFGAFLNDANPNLPQATVADLLGPHVTTLIGVIDAQAAGDATAAYNGLREAFAHMDMIATALTGGIVKQFPETFAGAADDPDVALRTAFNLALKEHAYLAAEATNAALSGRTDDFEAAAAALDANSVAIADALGSVYGDDVREAFLPSWRTHIGFFVDYTNGVAMQDQAMQDKAVQDLLDYAEAFGVLLNSVNENLPADAVAELVSSHVVGLKDAVDAQAAQDYETAYPAVREAYAHMQMIADALTTATVTKFPEQFATDTGEVLMADVACEQDYTVQADDWLSKIADKTYGDPLAFSAIFEATNAAAKSGDYDIIANADLIEPGWTLCLPSTADAQTILDGGSVVDDSATTDDGEAMEAMDGMMMGEATVLATSNPAEFASDMIAGLPLDLSATSVTFEGFSDIASVESIDLAANGDAYLTYDADASSGGIMVVEQLSGVSDALGSGSRTIVGPNTGLVAPKGLQLVESLGLILVADFGVSDIKAFNMTDSGDVAPVFTVTDLGGTRKVWDLHHDAASDILFVAGTDGAYLVYDDFSVTQGADGPDRVVTPVNDSGNKLSVNLHGIYYVPDDDVLILSDVGDAMSASDGQLFTIEQASSAVDTASVRLQLGGTATQLGNPVDLDFDGNNVYIAEKSNDVVLRYDDVLDLTGVLNVAADLTTSVKKAESVVIVQ